ncbi:MAG: dTDP-4-dehydrorhamnose reductase [uncultured bacterium]|nr:MAG: dTDP-4-dehydrorhamnose reductase [uncultured bacterium]
MIIVIGASGFIGSYIYENLKSKKYKLTGTYNSHYTNGLVKLNIENDNLRDVLKNYNIKIAVICASESSISKIENEKNNFHNVNVNSQKQLLEYFKEKNIKPVFISSDNIYDGNEGDYCEDDKRNPLNIYGKQKLEIENFIVSHFNNFLIVRLSKVYSSKSENKNFITDWINSLYSGNTLNLATDRVISPTHVIDIANIIEILIKNDESGIYNISSSDNMSYFDIGKKIISYFGFPTEQLKKVTLLSIKHGELIPKNTSLNSFKFKNKFQYNFISIDETIKKLSKEMKNNEI